jgi:diguanylate cyclase (GGDEF)-like protein
MSSAASRLDVLRRLPRRPADFYAVTDLDTSRRLGALMWMFTAVIVLVLLPVSPPTERIGAGGWAAAAGVAAICLLFAVGLRRAPERFTPNALVLMSYATLLLTAVLVWLGGDRSPWAELFIIQVLFFAAVHPPRRVGVFMLALIAAMALPLVYDGYSGAVAGEGLARLLLWSALAAISMLFTAGVRVARMAMREEEERARDQARRDPLTGLGNRRSFDETLEHAVAGARSSDRPLALVLADIDGFKGVNDRFGHLEGDRCLREVSAVLASTVRPSDSTFRWGGDEFAVLMPSTDRDQALIAIQRVVVAVASQVLLPGEEPLRLEYGVAEVEPEMRPQDLVAAADLQLMAAKAVEHAEPR